MVRFDVKVAFAEKSYVVWIGNPEPTVSARQPVLLAKQITCCDAIVGSVLNFDAMKQGS